MSEADANGLPETGTTAPEASADPGAANVQPGPDATWFEGLQDEDNRSYAKGKNWKTADDALKSQRELEAALSKSIRKPADDAPAEEWAAFWKKVGAPEKPDAYQFKLDAVSVPEDFPYDEQSAGEFRNWAFEAKVTPKQAQVLHDKFVQHQAKQFADMRAEATKQEESAHREIVSEWGEPSTPKYQENLTLAGRAITELGLKDAFVKGSLLGADGAVKDAGLARAMLRIGKELFQEGSAASPGDPKSRPKDAADILYS
jgi:hypothetical protein